MNTAALPYIPPAPIVPINDLPAWKVAWQGGRNMLAIYSERSFEILMNRAQAFGQDVSLCNDPDGIRHVLQTNHANYLRPAATGRIFRPLAGGGIFLANGKDWRSQRQMLSPIFRPANIAALLPHFQKAGADMARRLAGRATVKLSDAFKEATLDAVMRALFSLESDEERGRLSALASDYLTGFGRPNLLDGLAQNEDDFGFALWPRRRFQKKWFAALDAIIADRKAGGERTSDGFLDMLLAANDPETGSPLPDEDVRAQCGTMLFAGFETTSRLLFWAAYLLSVDTEEQSLLREEVRAFPATAITCLDDLQHWPRLRNVLLEALRLYPPAHTIMRRAVAADELCGESLPPGAQVWISPWVMHRHRKYWDQPSAFIPDRFAGQLSPWTSCGPFIPFGGGPRVCIGAGFAMAEAQIILATLLCQYEIRLHGTRPVLPVGRLTIIPSYAPSFMLTPVSD
jgi:cytochrome P450